MGEGARRDTRRRLTVDQAADQLGVSVDAVRARIKRNTMAHERVGGRVYVLLDTDQYTAQGTDQERAQDHTAELIRTLQEQLAAERQAHAEARRLLAAALERIPPQLEPPSQEAPEAPSEATPQPGRVEPQPSVEGTQEAREAPEEKMHMPEVHGGPQPHPERPWWRRLFGG